MAPKPRPDDAIVSAFLAKRGARRFEAGASGTPQGLRSVLEDHGYEVKLRPGGSRADIRAPGPGQRWRVIPLTEMVDLVDRVRVRQGLETIGRRP